MVLFAALFLGAEQELMTGKMSDGRTAQDIFYDRTQYGISNGVFMSVYKVFDKKKTLMLTFSLTHDRNKALFFIATKQGAGESKAQTIRYNKNRCGLIFSDLGNLDTTFLLSKHFSYLISFTDASRDYPILHKIKTENGNNFTFDPLSKIRIRKHKDLVMTVLAKPTQGDAEEMPDEEEEAKITKQFHGFLYQSRDSFQARNSYYTAAVGRMRNQIEKNISVLLKGKKANEETTRYIGARKKGNPEGIGLYISNGNYYDGNFREGRFISGTVILKNEAYEYCGGFIEGRKNGIGWLKYKNGNFDLGVFRDDALMNGASLDNRQNGETFFGNYQNGQRTGYGELRNASGGKYCGEFVNGRLVRGYAKETDPFGFTSYARIDGSRKIPTDSLTSENFFNSIQWGN